MEKALFTILNPNSDLGGAIYPLLNGYDWEIHSIPMANAPKEPDPSAIWYWVKDDKVIVLYIKGYTHEQFFAEAGISVEILKSPYTTSKRASRINRQYYISGEFALDELTIVYLQQNDRDKKVWDGAGRIHRRVLLRLIEQLPAGLDKKKTAKLTKELQTAKRIELTLQGPKGQDKCHAFVMEDEDEPDFVLPEDTKQDIRIQGRYIVALTPVSGHPNDVCVDIQTLINNFPFWSVENLLEWLHEEGKLFLSSIANGRIGQAMGRLDSAQTQKDIEAWHVREYFMSRGNAMWFGSVIHDLVNQQINRLEYQSLKKFKLPIPGARLYIAADEVGGKKLNRGEIELDPIAHTAWVNAEDWIEFIARILGGADQDDSLIVFPFRDYDGEKKILICRNPNQAGEYIILKPSANSETVRWQTTDGYIEYPQADSRNLPKRIDQLEQNILGLVKEGEPFGTGPYSHTSMMQAILRAQLNEGVLGLFCNLLMAFQGIYGRSPRELGDLLEPVIDAMVKTGDDLSPMREWIMKAAQKIIATNVAIPRILRGRIPLEEGERLSNPFTKNHWLDILEDGIKAHIDWMESERNALMAKAQPPAELFAAIMPYEAYMKKGAQFNEIYANALQKSSNMDLARARCEAFLKDCADGDRSVEEGILLAATASYYLKNREGADKAVWQMGEKTENGRKSGISQLMLGALRSIGILDEVQEIEGEVYRYPTAIQREGALVANLNGVWFNLARLYIEDKEFPKTMRDMDPKIADEYKAKIQAGQWNGRTITDLTLRVAEKDYNGKARKVLLDDEGNLVAYVEKGQEEHFGETVKILHAIPTDGNLRAILASA